MFFLRMLVGIIQAPFKTGPVIGLVTAVGQPFPAQRIPGPLVFMRKEFKPRAGVLSGGNGHRPDRSVGCGVRRNGDSDAGSQFLIIRDVRVIVIHDQDLRFREFQQAPRTGPAHQPVK